MKRKFSYVKILWIGLALWFGSIALRTILSLCGYEMPGQNLMLEELKDSLSVGILLVAMGVVAPILEEYFFRYWAVSRKKVLTLILFAVMNAFVALSTFWWLGVVGFLLCVSLDYFLRDRVDARNLALMLATSLLFALSHAMEFTEFSIDTVLCLTDLFGFALTACWLVYNLGFWWACLLHALNNTVALLIVILSPSTLLYTPTAVSFETPLYSASLQPIEGDTIDFRRINDSTVEIFGSLPSIALDLAREFNPGIISGTYSPTEFFKINISRREPSWKYTLTFHDTVPYGKVPWMVVDLAAHSRLQVDTTYEHVYVIGVEDPQKVNESKGERESSMAELAEDIRIMYHCPVVLEKGTNEFFPVRYDMSLFPYPYDIDALPEILSEKLGMFMYKSDVYKIQVVTFSDHPAKR